MSLFRIAFLLLTPALLLPVAAQPTTPPQPMAVAKRLDHAPPAAASSAPQALSSRPMSQATTRSSPPAKAPADAQAAAPRPSGIPLAVAKRL